MAEVRINKLTKKYGKLIAVNNLSIECKDKEFLVVLGPSGAGKTTTLRSIAGLEEVTEGEVYIDGVLVNNLHPSKRDIAMVFENYALYPHKTVFENIAYPLYVTGFSANKIENKVKNTASILGILELLHRYPRELSGGQKQRVAIGRAIVRNPKVFLMDEPIAHLDAKLRAYMRGELKHLQKEVGGTFIYTTHDQTEAMSMADRIAIIYEGILQQFDYPEIIYKHPVNMFVANFIGEPSMNFIQCTLAIVNDRWFLKHEVFELMLDEKIKNKISEKGFNFNGNKEVVLGIRPEHISLKNKKTKTYDIKTQIYITEPLGTDIIVDIMVGTQIIKVMTDASFKGDKGDILFIEVDQENIHLFDAGSKISII